MSSKEFPASEDFSDVIMPSDDDTANPQAPTNTQETARQRGYLDPDLKMTTAFTDEAEAALPEVTFEDIRADQERYYILLGHGERAATQATVSIAGIMQLEDTTGFYSEDSATIRDVKLSSLKRFAEDVSEADSAFTGMQMVGEIHTHPYTPEDATWLPDKPFHPSPGDIATWKADYASGKLSPEEPFVYMIAAQREDGTTVYGEYRVVQDDVGAYDVINTDT